MQRYFAKNIKDKEVFLEDGDMHHIKNVMRMKENDNIEVVYNEKLYLGIINKKNIEIKEEIKVSNKKDIKKILLFPLVKENKMNYVLQKATELNVFEIIPYRAERSLVKIDSKKEENKILRWQKIVKEASEQSKRIKIPKINKIIDFKEICKLNADKKMVCSVNNCKHSIKESLQDIKKYDTIIIVIGPEGGLSNKEESFLFENNFEAISLGEKVLRCETAPLFVLSVINYEFMG